MNENNALVMMAQFGRAVGALGWACNQALEELTDEHRVLFFGRIMAGYCQHCGVKTYTCHCTNDE